MNVTDEGIPKPKSDAALEFHTMGCPIAVLQYQREPFGRGTVLYLPKEGLSVLLWRALRIWKIEKL